LNAQDLKNSILQLAVQGKLVEQRAEEGTARELLEQIKLEKDQLIKDKKIKKSKPLPEITEDEIPFEIPESWEWVRLGDVVEMIMGQSPKGTDVVEGGDGIEFHQGKVYFGVDYLKSSNHTTINPTKIVEADTTLLCVRAPVGTVNITKRRICIGRGLCGLVGYGKIKSSFLLNWVRAFKNDFIKKATGTTFIAITGDVVREQIIPLPPLEEQHRIVAKIEEILPYIDQYDKAYTKLEIFNKKFPEDMKKSILQMAMQGKLVEQRAEEGTADELYEQIVAEKAQLIKDGKIKKEKPLPEITEDEIPFEIPSSWKWVKLNDLCEKIGSGSTPSGGRNIYKEEGIKFLRSQNVYNDGIRYEGIVYISEELNKKGSIVKAKDILLNITGGSIGRCAVVPDDFDIANINQHVMIIRGVNLDIRFWIHNIISSPYIQSKIMDVQVGVSREGLSAEKLKNFLIPLPPLEEQKRIVAKIEELLPYCDQLIK
jgi:type I restriction enzyme S subunit